MLCHSVPEPRVAHLYNRCQLIPYANFLTLLQKLANWKKLENFAPVSQDAVIYTGDRH